MTSPPPEPHFADGLLQRWAAVGLKPKTIEWLRSVAKPEERDPINMLLMLKNHVPFSESGDEAQDCACLRSLILAELAGARRARALAEEWAAVSDDDNRDGARHLARRILEAFNAK